MNTRIVAGEDSRILPWAAEIIGIHGFRSDAKAIGIERDGKLAGAVIFDTFSDTDCCMHVASDGSRNWLTRAFLREVFWYPFVRLGYKRVNVPVAESNKKARVFVMNLGFRPEGYHPYGAKDCALIMHGMLRANCRWIPSSERHMKDK